MTVRLHGKLAEQGDALLTRTLLALQRVSMGKLGRQSALKGWLRTCAARKAHFEQAGARQRKLNNGIRLLCQLPNGRNAVAAGAGKDMI